MIRRYDLTRSDNYVETGKVSYVCSGSGNLTVVTGFPVTSARVSFATLPIDSTNPPFTTPRIYVASYTGDGFVVDYENIPVDPGYIEFEYSCQ